MSGRLCADEGPSKRGPLRDRGACKVAAGFLRAKEVPNGREALSAKIQTSERLYAGGEVPKWQQALCGRWKFQIGSRLFAGDGTSK
jgi:hypothetical protein